MELQQPLDYVENYDQLDELKSATYNTDSLEKNQHPDLNIIDLQEDSYMDFE